MFEDDRRNNGRKKGDMYTTFIDQEKTFDRRNKRFLPRRHQQVLEGLEINKRAVHINVILKIDMEEELGDGGFFSKYYSIMMLKS